LLKTKKTNKKLDFNLEFEESSQFKM